jgi:cellulose synthase/poly-beta-1,6-N-acetylglucosamine synthase-like glycosyltransferase
MSSFPIYASLIAVAGIFYCLVVTALLVGLRRLPTTRSQHTPFVSIVVAARNEAVNLDRLLTSLTTQTYPNYEIVIANDRSEDETSAILERWSTAIPRIRLIHITHTPHGWSPKKYALTKAIEHSKGEIICLTDADCVPPPMWVSGLVQFFSQDVGVVAGYSPYDEGLTPKTSRVGFFRMLLVRFVTYEETKAALWSAGAIGLGAAWLCTGRNLAYRRSVFDEVYGFETIKHSLSGDDDLFLQHVRRTTRWRIAYAVDSSTFVPTAPPGDFPTFLQQRIRHFSAGKFFSIPMKLFFTSFHAAYLLILYFFLLWIILPNLSWVFPVAFGMKSVFDLALMIIGGQILGSRGLTASFLLMEILYIAYNTLIGPLGFLSRYEWKPELKS